MKKVLFLILLVGCLSFVAPVAAEEVSLNNTTENNLETGNYAKNRVNYF